MMTTKVQELKLTDYLIDDQKADRYRKLLDALKDESVVTASTLLQGFVQEIDNSLRDENKQRSLKELKLTFLE